MLTTNRRTVLTTQLASVVYAHINELSNAAMTILKTACKCARCGELMPAGTVVAWESVSYTGANGGGHFRGAARNVARHAEYCKALRVAELAEMVKLANEAHEIALGALFVANKPEATEARRAQCMTRFHEKMTEARRRIQDAKRIKALINRSN
jgi:hypothetical protein